MSQNKHIPIVQIVGYKSSGKTALLTAIIRYLSEKNIQVGTIKHHGHGGEPEFVTQTDSFSHIEAGAQLGGVQGDTQLQLIFNRGKGMSLDELLRLYFLFPLDVILIEGYKQANYPKIVLVRNEKDLLLLETLTNIIGVGAREKQILKKARDFQGINLNNILSEMHLLEQLIWKA
ncbi:molybdopterin-guanine dinucleotide biosynthesis protein B [Virgibacillus sp. W0430]|uniref:molybdopterin-guanine dinucleotide biosynthesis protein B n=1 Tax=Virgibacillus sp. W0430 TaxID=3391580 RepID=UPI003F457299